MPQIKSAASFDPQQLIRWLAVIVGVAIFIVIVVFATYWVQFHGGLSEKQEHWGQFGDYIGGTLNPILSFLALISLFLTVTLQSQQIRLSKDQLQLSERELELTREELRKSAEAQASTANALHQQARYAVLSARLSALNAALSVTSEQIVQMRGAGVLGGTPQQYQALLMQKESLASKILQIAEQLEE